MIQILILASILGWPWHRHKIKPVVVPVAPIELPNLFCEPNLMGGRQDADRCPAIEGEPTRYTGIA